MGCQLPMAAAFTGRILLSAPPHVGRPRAIAAAGGVPAAGRATAPGGSHGSRDLGTERQGPTPRGAFSATVEGQKVDVVDWPWWEMRVGGCEAGSEGLEACLGWVELAEGPEGLGFGGVELVLNI